MMEDNRLALAPVLVEDLNAVLRSNKAHFQEGNDGPPAGRLFLHQDVLGNRYD